MPNLYKAIIVEDELPARRLLRELLVKYEQFVHITGEAGNGAEAIRLLTALKPDLVFLDIQLPDMLGLEVLKRLDYDPYVVFTTAYDEYAIDAFEALSVDYLLKPLKEDRLARAIAKLEQFAAAGAGAPHPVRNNLDLLITGLRPQTGATTLAVKKGGKVTLVQLADIVYFEASDKYTFVHTANGQKLFCDHMLAVLEEKLPPEFIRVQKSYIVNTQKIVEIHKYSNNRYTLVLNNHEFTRIVTGPSYLPVIRDRLIG